MTPNGLPITRAAPIDRESDRVDTSLQNADDLGAAQRRRVHGLVSWLLWRMTGAYDRAGPSRNLSVRRTAHARFVTASRMPKPIKMLPVIQRRRDMNRGWRVSHR